MTSIEIRDLRYERSSAFRLGPLSLSLASGSRTAFVGPSGCGKTTLLRCLAGLETPAGGTLRFDGELIFGEGADTPPEQRRIGFVFQDGALWPHKSAIAQIRFVAPSLGRRGARELLAQVGLEGKEKRRPSQLSGGERQRLALARALAGEPRVLVLDEPLASVDVHLRNELALLVRRVAEERSLTVLVVTHDRDEALAMADDVVVLRDGQLVESGSAVDLLRAPETSFAASFLCRATCWPLQDAVDGRIATPFGSVPQNGVPGRELELVVLPGEARVAGGQDGVVGRVLRRLPQPGELRALVEVGGRSLEATCDEGVDLAPGREVRVALPGSPRLLRAHGSKNLNEESLS